MSSNETPKVPTVSSPEVETESVEDRLYTNKYTDHEESHLDVKDRSVCIECKTYDCASVCPADVWRDVDGGVPMIAYENCLECGSCRFGCQYDNVKWTWPSNGGGMTFKYG